MIHHGVPDMPFADSNEYKSRWGLQGKTVLLTFGLLHPRKGIEYMVEAMKDVVAEFPDAVYVVLGATHPPYRRRDGEKYRFELKALARDLGIEENVLFYDRFVTLEELTSILAACDLYVTPYLDPNQIVSGTLAYAMGLGKPIISTPYFYATEVLAEGRGVIVPVEDSAALAGAAIDLLSHPDRMDKMREKSYGYGREMIWSYVSGQYVELFEEVLAGRRVMPASVAPRRPISLRDLPRPRLDQLVTLTDTTGILHAAHFDIPDRSSGYYTDDNAMALAAVVLNQLQSGNGESEHLARTYLAMLNYMQSPSRDFRGHLNYDKSVDESNVGEDCIGKVMAGLGMTVALAEDESMVAFAKLMFDEALIDLKAGSLRSMAHAATGCYHYLTRFPGASLPEAALDRLAQELLDRYKATAAPGWEWFEDTLKAGNGVMPRALLLAWRATRNEEYRQAALESLDFLTRTCYSPDGYFDLVGDQGWFPRNGERARFNQLPVEAASLTEAYLDAYVVQGDEAYLELARAAFEWFLGRNALNRPLYDFACHCCFDSLMLQGPSPDKGADATIQWLLALLRIQTGIQAGPLEEEEALAGR